VVEGAEGLRSEADGQKGQVNVSWTVCVQAKQCHQGGEGRHACRVGVARVEIGADGKIVIIAGRPDHGSVGGDRNEWDAPQ
jgi:hypothetical protein